MADCINLTYDGKTYELAFTRESVKQMERGGFRLNDLLNGNQMATMSDMLFHGAFAARNPKLKRKVIDDIYDHLSNKADLLAALVELYAEPLSTLTDKAAVEDEEKNVSWEMA